MIPKYGCVNMAATRRLAAILAVDVAGTRGCGSGRGGRSKDAPPDRERLSHPRSCHTGEGRPSPRNKARGLKAHGKTNDEYCSESSKCP